MDRTDDDDVDLKRISVFKILSLITCLQYRPRALQHYTRVSCVEIHHNYCTQIPQEKHA